jgi:hypothetical protein
MPTPRGLYVNLMYFNDFYGCVCLSMSFHLFLCVFIDGHAIFTHFILLLIVFTWL